MIEAVFHCVPVVFTPFSGISLTMHIRLNGLESQTEL